MKLKAVEKCNNGLVKSEEKMSELKHSLEEIIWNSETQWKRWEIWKAKSADRWEGLVSI